MKKDVKIQFCNFYSWVVLSPEDAEKWPTIEADLFKLYDKAYNLLLNHKFLRPPKFCSPQGKARMIRELDKIEVDDLPIYNLDHLLEDEHRLLKHLIIDCVEKTLAQIDVKEVLQKYVDKCHEQDEKDRDAEHETLVQLEKTYNDIVKLL